MPNDKIYIHEFIDIIGHNRAKYMYHMTANFSPIAQEERNQLCYGVWAIIGTTRGWPEVLNLWEEDGWEGMATSFRHECQGGAAQDPNLARWWAKAAEYRKSGTDRLLIPAPWTRTITELNADGVRGECYAHEQVHVGRGRQGEFLDLVRDRAIEAHERFGWELAGAWETTMRNDDECFLLWAIPSWEQWAEAESAERAEHALSGWWRNDDLVTDWHRFLLHDSDYCPFKLGRQPSRDDRTEPWEEV
ncbi:MAG: hypothetical protein KDB21_03620 [Acidimicrobiales bacterium]|nr:hypothetical protein [Acidimicrobiales bacterium]